MSLRSSCAALLAGAVWHACAATHPPEPVFEPETVSSDVRFAEKWVRDHDDNHGRPYAIVDKKTAHIYIHAADGRLVGSSAVLTGLARGDESAPGIGQRPVNQIRPFERTTPAGRFDSQPGRTPTGEANVWIDYDTAIAIHRLRPGRSQPRRQAALASTDPAAHRQSYGCVVVPPAFFDGVVMGALGRARGVVYVLPEDRPVETIFQQTLADAAPRKRPF
jgi:hypothetical protein